MTMTTIYLVTQFGQHGSYVFVIPTDQASSFVKSDCTLTGYGSDPMTVYTAYKAIGNMFKLFPNAKLVSHNLQKTFSEYKFIL
jgi:hypothetical protein